MLTTRVIPVLLLKGLGLVKTVQFKNPKYLGDPRNVVRIFNDKEVDELVLLDITATSERREPKYDLIREIVSEAFMPVGYGGGITSLDQAKRIIQMGVEKVVLNSSALERPSLVTEIAEALGSQSVVVCLDVKRGLLGKYEVLGNAGTKPSKRDPVSLAKEFESMGAGEIVVQSIDRDGMMKGYDIPLVKSVSSAVTVPVVAAGGAGSVADLAQVVHEGGAAAAAAGSMFVFQGKLRAVLINFPPSSELEQVLGQR